MMAIGHSKRCPFFLIVFVANVRVRFAGQAMFDNLGGGTHVGKLSSLFSQGIPNSSTCSRWGVLAGISQCDSPSLSMIQFGETPPSPIYLATYPLFLYIRQPTLYLNFLIDVPRNFSQPGPSSVMPRSLSFSGLNPGVSHESLVEDVEDDDGKSHWARMSFHEVVLGFCECLWC